MATQAKASLVLDAKGLLCPWPVIKTSAAIKQIGVGEVLEVLTTDPGSKPDISAWARMTGHELLDVEESGGDPRVYRFQIRRVK